MEGSSRKLVDPVDLKKLKGLRPNALIYMFC